MILFPHPRRSFTLMRPRSPATGWQLKSVAYRYRCGLASAALRRMPARIASVALGIGAHHSSDASETVGTEARDHRLQRLEAVLFLAREPLTSRKLSQYANLADGTEARTLVRRLNKLYDRHGRAFRVERVAGGYQLLTRPQFASWVRRLEHVPREMRLSAPAMETLAVVAYRQPVLRADIEAVRGVSCDEILRQLMERNLVRIGGRSNELGRPYLYTTTRHFLRVFGLDSLDHLPRIETMTQAAGKPAPAGSPESEGHLSKSKPIEDDEGDSGQNPEEESSMPVVTLPDVETDKRAAGAAADDEALEPQLASTFDDEEDDEDYGEFYDDEEDDEDYDDDFEDYDDYDDEDEDYEDDFDDWEEVDDDSDWDDEDDSDWDDYDDEDDDWE